jgi:hypothetical protein
MWFDGLKHRLRKSWWFRRRAGDLKDLLLGRERVGYVVLQAPTGRRRIRSAISITIIWNRPAASAGTRWRQRHCRQGERGRASAVLYSFTGVGLMGRTAICRRDRRLGGHHQQGHARGHAPRRPVQNREQCLDCMPFRAGYSSLRFGVTSTPEQPELVTAVWPVLQRPGICAAAIVANKSIAARACMIVLDCVPANSIVSLLS